MNKYSSSVLDSDCSDELLKPPPPSPKEMTMDNHTPIHAHTLNKLLRKTLNQQIIKTKKMKKQQTLKGAIMKVTASDKLRTFVLDEDTIIPKSYLDIQLSNLSKCSSEGLPLLLSQSRALL